MTFSPFFSRIFWTAPVLLLLGGASAAQTPKIAWADTTLAETLLKESVQLNRDDRHPAALVKAEQAFDIYARLYGAEHVKTAKTGMYVARELRILDRHREAIAMLEQSRRVFEAAPDTFRMALCHHNIGLCLQAMTRYPEAMQHVRRAIALMRRDSVAQASTLADFYVAVGSIYNGEKNYLAAIPVLEGSKAVYTQTGNLYALGLVSYHIGNAYFGLNDFVRAKEHYLTAMANLKNTLKPSHSYFADLYVKIGLCYQKTDESDIGLSLLLEAKEAYLKQGEEGPNYIAFLDRLGQFYLTEQQYVNAIRQMELCLTAKEKRHGSQSAALAGTLLGLGEACMQAGQFQKAEVCYRRGLQIVADTLQGNRVLVSRFYCKLAELQLVQGNVAGSLLRCDTAFFAAGFDPGHPEKMLPRDFFRELCQIRARSLTGQFRQTADTALLFQAGYFFSLAAETLHRELAEIAVNSSREILYDRDYRVLEQWLETRMLLFEVTGKAEHKEMAFRIAGQSKAFLLAEAMRRSGALRFAGVPDSILRAESYGRERIAGIEKKLATISVKMDSAALSLNRDLSASRAQYDALIRRIEKDYPDYFRLRLLRHDVPTTELRKKWLAADQGLLMYSLTDTSVFAFVLTRDTFCAVKLPYEDSLREDMKKFSHYLTAYHMVPDPDDAAYDSNLEAYIGQAQMLYRALVLPVASLLPGRVVVIPDGELCYLPFEALLSGPPTHAGNFRTYPFWGEEKAISYCLSTDYLIETSLPPALKYKKKWLGIAPFAETGGKQSMGANNASNAHFPVLPFSGQEVGAIAGLLQGETWLDAEARPGRFRNEAAWYRILHLATHSHADDRSGHHSYLAVSNAEIPMPAKDLYQLSLAAEMVVLSACETGGGKLHRGEGIIGLVRAFTYAGARSIVASQWVAHDQSTAELMTDFYRNLRSGMPKDMALQQAHIHLVDRAPAAAHPFFWAGFRVFGNVGALWKVK